MIYTITLNPSIDYMVQLKEFTIGEINRSKDEFLVAGGKGINVSLTLKILNVDTTSIVVVAGDTGQYIESYLKIAGFSTEFIHLKRGFSRINVKINAKESTAINGIGPIIELDVIDDIKSKLQNFSKNDVLVLAGNIPLTAPKDIYSQVLEFVNGKDGLVVVDTSGGLLEESLEFKPFLIKPNTDELGELFQTRISGEEDIIQHAKLLQEKGARNIIVSRGDKGSLLLTENGEIYIGTSKGKKVINTVGCGDAMVAGFLAGYLPTRNYLEAYSLAIATSSAKALSNNEKSFKYNVLSFEMIQEIRKEVSISPFQEKYKE